MSRKIYSLLILLSLFFAVQVFGATEEELRSKIDDRNAQIKKLEEEIKQYNLEVENASKQKATLQSTIKTLDLTQKKINTDINLTQNKIQKTQLTIQQLQNEISLSEQQISTNKKAIGNLIKNVHMNDNQSIIEMALSSKDISDIWKDLDAVQSIQKEIRNKTEDLKVLTGELAVKQDKTVSQKNELVDLKKDLTGKQLAVVETKKEQSTLLTQTKNKEATFKTLVQQKEDLKNQFEQELYQYESQLNILIDKSSYPKPKRGILSWPLDTVRITQEFGKTVAAQKLYVSGSHNGVDFGASIGTRVKTVLDGVVVGTGNTDAYKGCYSFGKWVMIKHPNGLSTIYAHLSVISVNQGQELKTGDVVGYSGNTGYSTGPHLHLGLYATQGVRIEKYVNSRGCKEVVMPLADIKAYLDPLQYLPEI